MRTNPKLISLCLLAILAFSATYVVFSDDSSADSVEQDYTRYYYNQLDSDLARYLYDQFRQLPAENNGRDGIHADGDPAIVFERDYDLNAFASNPTTNIDDIEDEFGEAANAAFYAFQHECYDIYWIKHVRSPTVFRWYDSYSWDGEGVITSFHVRFCLYLEDSYLAQESARNQVWEAMNSIPLDMTNRYTAVRSAHDAAVKILGYSAHLRDHDDNGYNCDIRSVYEAFVGDHAIVCEAYSKVFKALCDMHGIPCILVDGEAGNSREAHMWNYVQMEDGKWYAVDCTWDDQSLITYDYLLAGTNTPVFNGATFGEDHFPALSTDSGDFRIPPLAEERYNAFHTVNFVTYYDKTSTQDVIHGGTLNLSAATAEADCFDGYGAVFSSWNTEPDGSGTSYAANASLTVNSNTTLYAMWTAEEPEGECTLDWEVSGGVLTISGTGAMEDYTFENHAPWYPYRNAIWKVEVGDGVTYVGNYAFHAFLHLITVELGSNVTSIGCDAFFYCDILSDVYYENNAVRESLITALDEYGGEEIMRSSGSSPALMVSVDGGNLYLFNSNGTYYVSFADVFDDTLTLPEAINGQSYAIGAYAFQNLDNLRHVVMLSSSTHHGVEWIGDHAFSNCQNLVTIGLSPYITHIGANAFSSCTSLTGLALPSGLTEISAELCSMCPALKYVSFPAALETIGSGAFVACTGLTEIVIPDDVTIGENAFGLCTGLQTVTFGDGLTIASNAFSKPDSFPIPDPPVISFYYGEDVLVIGDALCNQTFSGETYERLDSGYARTFYVLDGEVTYTDLNVIGNLIPLRDKPTVSGHVVTDWEIPGIAITEDGKFRQPAGAVYVYARSLQQYCTVTIDIGDGTIQDYDGIWDQVDAHTYALDIAWGTDVSRITTYDSDPLYFDSSLIEIEGYHFVSWQAYSLIVNGIVNITAVFEIDTYNLTLGNNGAGTVSYNDTSITITTAPSSTGFHVVSYYVEIDEETYTLADPEGNLQAGVPGYTDANGRWIHTGAGPFAIQVAFLGNVYDIVLDKNDGDASGTAKVTFRDCGLSEIGAPTKEHYMVEGYYLEQACETLVANADGSFVNAVDGYIVTGAWERDGGATLYAKWTIATYALTLTGNGGSDGTGSVAYNATSATITTPCVREHYNVSGYYTETVDGTLVILANGTLNTGINGYTDEDGHWIRESATTLYPHWTGDQYELTYDGNGGSDGTGYIAYGQDHLTFETTPQRTGYTVEGYYSAASDGVKVANGQGVLEFGVENYTSGNGVWIRTEDTTLYARWTANSYDIVLNANGGDAAGTAKAVFNATSLSEISAPTKEHYMISGYYLEEACETLVADAEGNFVENLTDYITDHKWTRLSGETLYAKWTGQPCTITVDKNGGDSDGRLLATYGSKTFRAGSTAPQRAGYTSFGYYLEETCQTMVASNSSFVANVEGYTDAQGNWIGGTSVTIYAKWTANLCSLRLNPTEGSAQGSGNITFGTSTVTISTPPTWFLHHAVAFYADEERTVQVIVLSEGNYVTVAGVDNYTDAQGNWIRVANPTTLYTEWEGNAVNLVLDKNGGASDGSAVVRHGTSTVTDFHTVTRIGYSLDGYYSRNGDTLVMNASGVLQQSAGGYTDANGKWTGYSSGNDGETIHLVAHWTANTTAITLDKNEGSANSSVTATYDSALPDFDAISRTHYNLTGYWTAAENGTLVINADGTLNNSEGYVVDGLWAYASPTLTLYAQWEPKTTAITLDKNNGTEDGSVTATYGQALPGFDAVTRTGYNLTGYWTAAENGTMIISANGTLADVDGYADEGVWTNDSPTMTLYAQWTVKTTTITLDRNGGAENRSVTATYGQALPAFDAITRVGYTLTGYCVTSQGSTKVINANGTLNNSDGYVVDGVWANESATLTLYASWWFNSTSITFDKNGGDANSFVSAGYDRALPGFSPVTRTGYELTGYWTASQNGTKIIEANGSLINITGYSADGLWKYDERTLTLYAQWIPKTTAVTINVNGGAGDPRTPTATYDAGISVFDTVTKTGYNLTGYWTAAQGGTMVINADGNLVNANGYVANGKWACESATLTLYAQWTPHTNTVIINVNGGAGENREVTVSYDQGMPLFDAVTRTGYDLRYYSAANGDQVVNADGAFVNTVEGLIANGKWAYTGPNDIELFAQWTAKTTAITINVNGGAGEARAVTATYGGGITPFLEVTRTGYILTGYWTAAENGIEVIDANGNLVNSDGYVSDGLWANVSAALTLYAQWTPHTNTVIIDVQGGDGENRQVTVSYDQGMPDFDLVTKTGYNVQCYAASNGAPVVNPDGTFVNEANDLVADGKWVFTGSNTIRLYTYWLPKTTDITINANGGAANRSSTATYDEGITPFDAVTRTGYNLTGYWTAAENGTMVIDADGNLVNANGYVVDGKWANESASLTLYAQWSSKTIVIFINGNGIDHSIQTTIQYDSPTITFDDFVRTGYNLTGYWTAAENGTKIIEANRALVNGTEYVTDGKWASETTPINLYAQWALKTTAITIDVNGGAGENRSTTATYNAGIEAFDAVTRTGYFLDGYYTQPGRGVKVINADGTLNNTDGYVVDGKWARESASLTLYAHWNAHQTMLFLEPNGAGGFIQTGIGYDSTSTSFTPHTRTGYNLTGYWTAAEGGTKVFEGNGPLVNSDGYVVDGKWANLSEELRLYAQWTPKTTAITINANEGSANRSSTATYGAGITPFDAITRDHYDLTGYWTLGLGNSKIINADGSLVPGTAYTDANGKWIYEGASLELMADWEGHTYEITLYKNGGSADGYVTVIYGSSTLAAFAKVHRTGFDITGYWTAAEGGVKLINSNDALNNVEGYVVEGKWIRDDDVPTALYAQWTPHTTAITINVNGGAGDNRSSTATYGAGITPFDAVTRTGYNLTGYWTSAEGGVKMIDADGTLVRGTAYTDRDGKWQIESATVTLYAQWSAKTYTIVLDSNGGTASGSVTATYGSSTLSDFIAVTRTGYLCTGYFSDPADGAEIVKFSGTLVSGVTVYTDDGVWTNDLAEPLTLYPHWYAKTTAVTLDKNGGSADSSVTATFDSALPAFDAVTRTGYNLAGYFTAAENGIKVIDASGTLVAADGHTADGKWANESENLTLFAQWTPKTTTLTLDKTDGNTDGQATATYDLTTISVTTAPAKQNYVVRGYAAEADGQIVAEADGRLIASTAYTDANGKWTSVAAEVTLYTVWSDIVVNVVLEGVEGTDGSARAVFGGSLIDVAAPTRTGYDIEGYYTDEARTQMVAEADGTLIANINGYTDGNAHWTKQVDFTLYAQWTAKTYRIVLDKGDGTADGYADVTFGSSAVANFTAPTKLGYHSIGYYYNGVMIIKHNGELVTTDTVLTTDGVWDFDAYETLTFDPNWMPNNTDITLNKNGGDSDQMAFATYDAGIISYTAVTRAGYTLTGYWTAAENGMKVIDENGALVNADGYVVDGKWINTAASVTLYAQWTAKSYALTLTGDGETDGSATATFDGILSSYVPATKTGYTVAGYNNMAGTKVINADGSLVASVEGYTDANGKWIRDGIAGFTAVWTANTHTLTIHYKYSDTTEAAPDYVHDYDFAVEYLVDSPAITGYTADRASVSGAMPDENVTVTVIYTVNKYTITFSGNGGSPAGVMQELDYGALVVAPADPEREGFVFKGWEPAVPATMPAENITVNAVWSAKPAPAPAPEVIEIADTRADTVVIDKDVPEVNAALDNGSKTVVDVKGDGWTMEIPKDIITGATGNVSAGAKTLSDEAKAALPDSVKEKIQGKTVFSLDLKDGNGNAIAFTGTKVKVSLPYELAPGESADGIKVFYINGENLVEYDATYDAEKGVAVFETDHFSDWFVSYVAPAPASGNGGGFPILIVVAVVAVLAVAAVGAVFYLKKAGRI